MSHRGFFARSTYIVAGALGIVAGALVAYELAAPRALASEPAHIVGSTVGSAAAQSDAPKPASGIVFLDSSAAPRPASAATPAEPRADGGALRTIAMIALLAAGVVGWIVMRRRQTGKGGPSAGSLTLVGSVRIAGRWQVALVKVPGKVLVLGATDKGLTLLSELDDDVLEASEPLDTRESPEPERESVSIGARASSEPFTRLLDNLTRAAPTSPARERIKTDDPQILRARLERHHQTAS